MAVNMIKRMRYRYKVLGDLYPYAYGFKKYGVLLLFFSSLGVGLEFVAPLLYKAFINYVILRAELQKLAVIILGYFVLYFLGVTADWLKYWARYTLVNGTTFCLRQKILDNFFKMQFSAYEKVSVGDLKMRIDDDVVKAAEFAGSQTIDLLLQYVTIGVSAWMLLHIDWRLAIFSAIAIPFTFWLDGFLGRCERKVIDSRRENDQEAASWLHACVQGWMEIRALNLAKHEERRYCQFLHTDMRYNAKWINYWTARVLVIPKLKDEFFMQFGLYFTGGLLILWGNLHIGDLLVFAMYYSLLSGAVQTVSAADANLEAMMPFTDRLMESLSLQGEEKREEAGKVPDESNTIAFKDVSFCYPDSQNPVLKNINIKIEKGERIAITGKSGSGKTTLLKLITGMLQPTEGAVFFAGIDLKDIDLSAMHGRIGYIMQENILFHTTIRENLFLGKEDATEEELAQACQKACIYEFIASLPEGMDTIIGEKGIKLSGGQKQRIILARMFLRDIDVFILDEATSALDQYSESIVGNAICNIPREKTVIIVSHRESALKICDRIIKIGHY